MNYNTILLQIYMKGISNDWLSEMPAGYARGQDEKEASIRRLMLLILVYGAGDGNRTHTASLEGWNSNH